MEILGFYRMGPFSYLAVNICYPSTNHKNDSEGDSEIISTTTPITDPEDKVTPPQFLRVAPTLKFQQTRLPHPGAGTQGLDHHPAELEG